jgi:hypothetical protein
MPDISQDENTAPELETPKHFGAKLELIDHKETPTLSPAPKKTRKHLTTQDYTPARKVLTLERMFTLFIKWLRYLFSGRR